MNQEFLSVRAFFCFLATAALIAVAGCGGSDDSNQTLTVETGSLSKNEFIKQADEICAATTDKVEAAGQRYSEERSSGSQAAVAEQLSRFVPNDLVPDFEEEIDQIASLGAPPGDKAKITQMLRELQRGLDDAKANPTELFLKPSKSFAKAAAIGQTYGFSRCGSLT